MAFTCQRCGANVPLGAANCPSCGAEVPPHTQPNNVISAVCYLGFALTGIVFLLVEPYRNDDQVRFHARQSIAFTVAWFAFYIIMSVLIAVMPGLVAALLRFVADVGYIGFAALWIYLMYQAYIGNRFRVPYVGDWADAVPL